jgi:hypothetical protein
MVTPANNNADLLKAINTLTKAVDGISKSMLPRSGRPRSSAPGDKPAAPGQSDKKTKREADAQYERNKRLTRNQEKSIDQLAKELDGFSKSVKGLQNSSRSNQSDYKLLLKQQNEHAKTILESGKLGRKVQDKFVKQMEDMLKSSKSMSNIKLKGTTTGARTKELLSIQESMNEVLVKASGMKRGTGAKNVASMKEGDIKSLMKSMGDRGLTADGMGVDAFNKKLGEHDSNIAKKKRAIAKTAGRSDGRRSMLEYELKIMQDNRNGFLADTGAKIDTALGGVDKFNKSLTDTTVATVQREAKIAKIQEIGSAALEKMGIKALTATEGLKMMGRAMMEYYKYMKSLASSQMGGLHFSLAKDALAMGTSVEATAQYFKTLGTQVSQIGFKGVQDMYRNNKETMAQLGFFGDEALKYSAEFSQDIMKMGVSPKDTKKFNAAFKNYGKEINEMAMLTGASVSEILAMNKALISSSESQAMMMRLNKEERGEKMKTIIAERNRLVGITGSNEEAQKFIQTMQKLNSAGPQDRVENAMSIQQLMQMTGMGADAGRMGQIMAKRDDQLTASEQEFKNNMIIELGKRSKAIQGTGNYANEMMINSVMGGLRPELQSAIQGGAEAALAKDQNGSIDKNSATAQQVMKDKQISGKVSSLMDLTNWLSNASSNPMLKVLWGILGGIGVIAASSWVKSKGGPGAVAGMAADALTKGSGVLSKGADAIKGIGKGGATVATDVAKTAATDVAKTAGKDVGKAGAKSLLKKVPGVGLIAGLLFGANRLMDGDMLGAAGEVASGAASTLPGIGTAASAAIDAGLLARDVSKTLDENAATEAPVKAGNLSANANAAVDAAQAASATPSSSSDTINKQSPAESAKKATLDDLLNSIVGNTDAEQTKLDEMITLLKTLIDAVKPENNGLLDAIRSGNGTKMSFNDLQNKRTFFANK